MTSRTWLLASGSNGSGQLGIGHAEDVSTYTYCQFSSSTSKPGQMDGPSSMSGTVAQITSGAGHSLLLLNEDLDTSESKDVWNTTSLWTTGSNQYNQLGPDFATGEDEPSHTSWRQLDHMSCIKAAGLPIETTNRYSPKKIACSWSTSVVCFGHERQGPDGVWSKLSDKTISFGSNDFGELGCGDERNTASVPGQGGTRVHVVKLPESRRPGERLAVRVIKASHRNFFCICDRVSDTDGRSQSVVYGWGAGRHGQLDLQTAVLAGVSLEGSGASRKGSSVLAKSQPPVQPRLAMKERPTKSLNGSEIAVRSTGGIRLKKSTYPSSYPCPVELDVVSAASGKAARGSDWMVDDVAVGAGHVLFRLRSITCEDCVVMGLGSNAKHQLDLHFAAPRSETPRWAHIACTWNGSFLTEEGDRIWSTGTNTHGQLGRGGTGIGTEDKSSSVIGLQGVRKFPSDCDEAKIIKVVGGSEHLLALTRGSGADIKTWTWGWNEHGNLGLGTGDVQDRWEPVEVAIDATQTVLDAWAGCGTSWLLIESTSNT